MLSQTVRLFLDSLGRSEEYEYYLKRFQSVESDCFAILAPDASCIQALDALNLSLRYLLRLELLPLILLTGPGASKLSEELKHSGARVQNRVFANLPDRGELLEWIRDCSRRRSVPTLVLPHTLLRDALRSCVSDVARRVHLIRYMGALRDAGGQALPYYRFSGDTPSPTVVDRPLLHLALPLVKEHRTLHLSVTSPYNLLKEIFTIKGAGTVIRPGSRIHHFKDRSDVDIPRLRELMRESFVRPLIRENFLDQASHFYIEADYAGAILLEERSIGCYLSKFAVGARARGLGIAQELWERVLSEHQAIFWRARVNNSITRWYARLADGMHRSPPWLIFWRGVSPESIPEAIQFCEKRAEDFAEPN